MANKSAFNRVMARVTALGASVDGPNFEGDAWRLCLDAPFGYVWDSHNLHGIVCAGQTKAQAWEAALRELNDTGLAPDDNGAA